MGTKKYAPRQNPIKFADLPDTIGPKEYAAWRGCGIPRANEKFHEDGFPLLKNNGKRLQADKREVYIYELNLPEEEKLKLLKSLVKEVIGG